MAKKNQTTDTDVSLSAEGIEHAILLIRGQKVMLDRDLARLYGVQTKNLNKAVSRNLDRFPSDFMFQLTAEEHGSLRFQSGTLKRGQHSKYRSFVFTQEERKIENHDETIRSLFDAIHQLMTPEDTPHREIGFHIKEDGVRYRVNESRSASGKKPRRVR